MPDSDRQNAVVEYSFERIDGGMLVFPGLKWASEYNVCVLCVVWDVLVWLVERGYGTCLVVQAYLSSKPKCLYLSTSADHIDAALVQLLIWILFPRTLRTCTTSNAVTFDPCGSSRSLQ